MTFSTNVTISSLDATSVYDTVRYYPLISAVEIHVVHLEEDQVKRKKTVTFKPENLTDFKEAYPDEVIIVTELDLAELILKWS